MDPARAAELDAMNTSSAAIEPLPDPVRRRVVRWLADVFDVDLAQAPDALATAASPSPASTANTEVSASVGRKQTTKKGSSTAAASARAKAKSTPGHDKDLNLYPDGKESFEEFVGEKEPADRAYEHNVVAVYWLTQIAEVEAVTVAQVFSCYRNASWKLPHDLRNNLQQTASHKGWLDT